MRKSSKILLLRASYWTGTIVDAFVAVELLLPAFWASFEGLTTYTPNSILNFALGTAGALMLGWTLLLVWADRKPLERKGVLLLTVFPVIFGIQLNNIASVTSGLRSLQSALVELAVGFALAVLFIFSYWNARHEAT
jgi:hypothetical protein